LKRYKESPSGIQNNTLKIGLQIQNTKPFLLYLCASMKWLYKPIFFLILATILAACATMVQPNGGPVDKTPPIPEVFSPANGSMNMTKKKVVIRFDEFIVLEKLIQQLVVSPPMPEDPVISIQGKKLIIELPDSLRPNTTYTIFFGDAVRNFKENLPTHNFSYVFSTGLVVDSLSISGMAVNAFNHAPYEELTIMMYKNQHDSVLYKEKPYYLTKTESSGRFSLQNLAEGEYQIFALKDENRNYNLDQSTEEIAFIDSLVIPHHPAEFYEYDSSGAFIKAKTPPEINLFVFSNPARETKLVDYKVTIPNKVQFYFNRPISKLNFIPLDFKSDTTWHFETYSSNRDSITTYLMAIDKDTINVAIADGEVIIDTLELVLIKKQIEVESRGRKRKNDEEDVKKAKVPVPKPKIGLQTNINGDFAFFGHIELRFTIPLNSYIEDRIQILRPNDTIWEAMDFKSYFSDSTNHQRITIETNFDERSNYKIRVLPNCFHNIYHSTNDTLEQVFSTNELRNYGSLLLNVQNIDKQPLIIQLMNSKNGVLQEHFLTGSESINYPYLADGKYIIKAIVDTNKNRKWDNGDLEKRIQPERIYFLPQLIDIRANWDNEQVWIIEK
jgi:uncharacterized protein (DUF2141 family)